MKSQAKRVAVALLRAGISVVPIKTDGSKAPAIRSWKKLQSERMPPDEFPDEGTGVGIIAGRVSGNLEIIDVEGPSKLANGDEIFREFWDLVEEAAPGLMERLPRFETPSGGRHIFYRSETIEGNQKLASRATGATRIDGSPEVETVIETRGEGGYVIAAGSPGSCHPSGDEYRRCEGSVSALQTPIITAEERQILHDCARSFNSVPDRERYVEQVKQSQSSEAKGKPGTDYSERGDVVSLLEHHGHTIVRRIGSEIQLRRAGKKGGGISMVWNHGGHRILWVFSSNAAPFEPDRGYTGFAVYALLEHGGDFKAAARRLAADGYGDQSNERRQKPAPSADERSSTQSVADDSDAEDAPKLYERPTIQISGGSLSDNVDEGEAALSAYTAHYPALGIYERSGILCGVKRERSGIAIVTKSAAALRVSLTAAADWASLLKTENRWVPKDAPDAVARGLVDMPERWRTLPSLAGIVESPVMRADGSILSKPGYDRESQLYYDPAAARFPEVPESPTREDALEALDVLKKPIEHFPFADDASRSVALAMMLTPLVRHALRSAPMFAISAPKPGSGKTLLSDMPAYMATGRPPELISQSDDPGEEKKRYLALLLQGAPVLCLDNVERSISSDSLCTILTEPVWRERLLGTNRSAAVSTATTWVATGNNIVLRGDISARTLLCYLDPQVERPEERKFSVNLHEAVPAARTRLVRAALTVLRAYRLVDSKDRVELKVFGRFEEWSRFVRAPLIWLGQADPCDTRAEIQVSDPVQEQLGDLLVACLEAFGDKDFRVADLADRAGEHGSKNPLSVAIDAVAGESGPVNRHRLGKFISRSARRIERGLRFERGGTHRRAIVWKVVRVS